MSSPKNFHNAVDVEKLGINKIPEIEKKIDEMAVLPGVTSADVGKIVKVNSNGDWVISDDPVVYECTFDSVNEELTFPDGITVKTIIEMIIDSKRNVILNCKKSGASKPFGFFTVYNSMKGSPDRNSFVQFVMPYVMGNLSYVTIYTTTLYKLTPSATSSSVDKFRIPSIPVVSGDDDGKLLQVVNGGWSAVAHSSELPVVTSDDNGKLLEVVNGAWSKSNDISDKVQFIYDYLNLSGEELVHSYDFTQSGNDLVSTDPVNLTSESATTFSAGGLQVSANDHMQLRGLGAICGFNRRLVFEMGVNNITGAGNLLSVYNGNSIKWTGTEWTINGISTGITNPNYFYNKVLQIKIGASYDDVKIMTQDGVIYEGSFNPAGDFGGLMIGGFEPNGGCCYSFYVKTLKVYTSF